MVSRYVKKCDDDQSNTFVTPQVRHPERSEGSQTAWN
jgi:hypothetical protein